MAKILKKIVKQARNRFGTDTTRMPPPAQKKSTQELLEDLDTPFKTALISMYQGEPQEGMDGQLYHIDTMTRISPEQGMWFYELCLAEKPRSTLEIGMAYGYSTLYFLAALAQNQKGDHTAIDPFQRTYWHGIGLVHATANTPSIKGKESFRFIEDRSDRAAADLARENRRYDVIFIDGNHRFDDVLVDFYLYAQICAIGGRIIFDDMWMSSIQTAVDFIRTNRVDFVEVPTKLSNVAVFRKTGDDQRKWNEFISFKVVRK